VSSLSSRPLPRSRSTYQVDGDRVDHLSCSDNRNSTSYSSYFQDCVDRDGRNRSPRRWHRTRALVVPTKLTKTGSPTFPILTTGTPLLTLPIFKMCRPRRLSLFSSSLAPNPRSRCVDRDGRNRSPCRRRQARPPFLFRRQELLFLLFLSSRLCRPRRLSLLFSSLAPEPHSLLPYQVDEDRVNHLSCFDNRNSPSYSSYPETCVDRKVASVLSVLSTVTTLSQCLPSRRGQSQPPFRF
jgi:hypothetical protein